MENFVGTIEISYFFLGMQTYWFRVHTYLLLISFGKKNYCLSVLEKRKEKRKIFKKERKKKKM